MITKKMMGTVAVLGIVLAGGNIVNAQTRAITNTGTTPVTYDNRTVIADDNAQYGMIIPTAISFTDDKQTADASLEIVGINGYDLDNDWTELNVTAKVKSTNGYTLDKGAKKVPYKITMTGNTGSFESGTDEKEITTRLGVGANTTSKKISGTAELNGKATEKGQYSDTLTYTFTENTNTLT